MRMHMTQLASQQAPCEIHSTRWPLFTIPPSSSSPPHPPPSLGAANAFPIFMRYPLAFPVQPFSFSLLLLFAWQVEVYGPEVNMVQHSGAKHRSPELFLSGKVCFQRHLKRAICDHCTWLYEQNKSEKFWINGCGSR